MKIDVMFDINMLVLFIQKFHELLSCINLVTNGPLNPHVTIFLILIYDGINCLKMCVDNI